ncbi:hypothetical protein HID58_056683, partial [Brassica napus]
FGYVVSDPIRILIWNTMRYLERGTNGSKPPCIDTTKELSRSRHGYYVFINFFNQVKVLEVSIAEQGERAVNKVILNHKEPVVPIFQEIGNQLIWIASFFCKDYVLYFFEMMINIDILLVKV